jgi:hypothetical protein
VLITRSPSTLALSDDAGVGALLYQPSLSPNKHLDRVHPHWNSPVVHRNIVTWRFYFSSGHKTNEHVRRLWRDLSSETNLFKASSAYSSALASLVLLQPSST